nr:hypothetical protein [Tanacetum cinerariifolium]
MGKLTFFLGLQVQQKKDGIFICQDKYVADILRKFRLTGGKSASTPIDTKKPLLKDPDGEDVDVHTYRSMIGSLMYLTSSRPDIVFAVVLSDQTVSGKDSSNPLMSDNLPKIIWHSTHHVALMKSWLVQKQTALGQMATGKEISNPFMAGSLPKTIFLTFIHFWTTVVVKKVNDITRLQALVDKKKVVVTESTIRDALHLDDAEGVDCSPNKEIFAELAIMGYMKPSTKLTKQVGGLSTHTTKYTFPALTQKVFDNMRRVGKGFSGVETQIFEGMLVAQEVEEGDADENVENVNDGDAAEGDVSVAHEEVPTNDKEPSIPSPTPTPPP